MTRRRVNISVSCKNKSFVFPPCPGSAGGSGGGELRVCLQEHVRPSVPHHQDHVDPRHQGDLPRSVGHQWRLPTNLEGRKGSVETYGPCSGSVRVSHLLFFACVAQVSDTETRLECLLNNNKNSDFCAPLTSFDWNEVDPNLLGECLNPRTHTFLGCLTC